MIEERAVVVEVGEDGHAWLEIQRRSACSSCSASEGCGTSALAKVWDGRRSRVRVICRWPLRVGDEVLVGLADGALLRGALLAYLLPLALLLAGALLGETALVGAVEEPVAFQGAIGIVLGLVSVRLISRRWRQDARYQPVVLRPLNVVAVADRMLSAS